ncbi:MAG: lamin tail domain-containing protein, partial [Anaerolineales bacterium]|nr:lamin tail domain-containing protein [Anaerolineales bacterium]
MSKNRLLVPALLTVLFLLLSTVSPTFAADAPNPGEVLINEYVPKSSTEWVELYNTTASDLDISGFYIDNIAGGGGAPEVIPAGTIISAGGYYVMTFSNYFKNNGDDVRFIDPTQTVVHDST